MGLQSGRDDDWEGLATAVLGAFDRVGSDTVRGDVQGRPVWLTKSTFNRRLQGLYVCSDLGGRPVELQLRARSGRGPGVAEITTGDASFDARFLVRGSPADAVRAALDEPMRRALTAASTGPAAFAGADAATGLDTANGYVRIFVRVFNRPGDLRPEELAPLIPLIQDLGQKIASGYDAAYAAMVATRGEAAAAAWRDRAVRARAADAALERKVRLGCLIAAIVLALAAGAFWLLLPPSFGG